eukprot:gene11709-12209_t
MNNDEKEELDTFSLFSNDHVDDSVRPPAPNETKELKSWYMFDWSNSVYSQVVIGGYLPLLLQSMALANAGFPDQCPNYYPMEPNAAGDAFVGIPEVTLDATYFAAVDDGGEASGLGETADASIAHGAVTLTSMDIFGQAIDFFQDDALTGKSKAQLVGQMTNHTLNTPETCPKGDCENGIGYDYNDWEWCKQYVFEDDSECTITVAGVGEVTRSPCWTLFCTGPPTTTYECLEADAKTEYSLLTVEFGSIDLDPTAFAYGHEF